MTIRIDCGTIPNSKRFDNSRLQIDVRVTDSSYIRVLAVSGNRRRRGNGGSPKHIHSLATHQQLVDDGLE